MAVDLVISGGSVLTMDAGNTVAEAVAISDGKIVAVGSRAEIEGLANGNTRRQDLRGRTLLPGFIDPHSHYPESGRNTLFKVALASPPIGECIRLADVLERLRERAARTPKGDWVLGWAFDDTLMAEQRFPTRAELDAVTSEHPIFVTHSRLEPPRRRQQPGAGARRGRSRDASAGRRSHSQGPVERGPTGVLEEPGAMELVRRRTPRFAQEETDAAFTEATRQYASQGVTYAQNAAARRQLLEQLVTACRNGKVPLRFVFFPEAHLDDEIAAGRIDVALPNDGRARIGARKLFADGSIQRFTGYLSKPYHTALQGDPAYRGYPIYPRDELARHVVALHERGHQIAIHGNGDAAIDDIIHAHRKAQERVPRRDCRHIVVHAQMARTDQLDAMAELGLTPSFFSLHTWYWGDRHRDIFIGPERAARISPARSAGARGIRYTLHCDTPVTPMTPLLLIWAAVNRRTTSGLELGAEERIDALTALRAHTIDAAWQIFDEARVGSIEPGKLADLVVLERNPLDDPATIKDIAAAETMLGGEAIFRRANA